LGRFDVLVRSVVVVAAVVDLLTRPVAMEGPT
jgi:hypothetical protein